MFLESLAVYKVNIEINLFMLNMNKQVFFFILNSIY